jgi:hypothetical protein
VRKNFGWKRIDAPAAIEAMNALYRNELPLFLNYFQPSVKLVERHRLEAAYAESMTCQKHRLSDLSR